MKILLIDDHALFRDGMLLVLEGLAPNIEAFEAGSYESAKSIIDGHNNFDLVLLDLGLPGISYLDALTSLRQQLTDTPIVVLSGSEDQKMVAQALQQGARGYIPKSSPAKLMLSALQLVLSGGTYIPPEILQHGHKLINTSSKNGQTLEAALTERQRDVLYQLAEGKSNKEIGSALNLTESTIRVHVAAILKSFGVKNRTHAVQHAIQKGWIQVNSQH